MMSSINWSTHTHVELPESSHHCQTIGHQDSTGRIQAVTYPTTDNTECCLACFCEF